tara:strand:- start:153 stop:446 length:294 start_codon:yes stop_codon:yes gene_type:complete
MSKWKNLKNGGEIYEGDDASDFPEAPLGDEIGRYESDNEFIITHIANDEYYTYITHRFPGGGGDTGIVMRFEKYGVEDDEITIGDTNWIDITKAEAL